MVESDKLFPSPDKVTVEVVDCAWNVNQASYVVVEVAPPHVPVGEALVAFRRLYCKAEQVTEDVNETGVLQLSFAGCANETKGIVINTNNNR